MLVEFTNLWGDKFSVNPAHVVSVYTTIIEPYEDKERFEAGEHCTRIDVLARVMPSFATDESYEDVKAKLERIPHWSEGQGGGFIDCMGSGAPNDPRP